MIDAAPANATITVHSGTYSKIRLKSDLSVVAAAGETPIITNASGSWQFGIELRSVRNVVVRGLTVQANFIGVFVSDASNTLIEGNTIVDNAEGIELRNSVAGVVVRGNTISANNRVLDASRGGGAIGLYYSAGGVIEANTIVDNTDVGIEVYGASDTIIRHNYFAGSAEAIETGVDAGGGCARLAIVGNAFERSPRLSSEQHGIWWRCGSDSRIEGNSFTGLDRFMVGIGAAAEPFGGPMHGLVVTGNTFSGGRAYYLSAGRPTDLFIDGNYATPCSGGACPVLGSQVAQVADAAYYDHCKFSVTTGYDKSSGCR